MRLFFNYSIDCELPPDGRFGGPATWELAEASVRGFVEVMDEMGLRQGTSLFVYPDVAMKQRALYREMADAGIEIALHLHAMRYSKWPGKAWLGSLSYEQQVEILGMAKRDLEDVIGRPVLGFKACYASGNHDTCPACEAAGFVWTSTSAQGSYKPDIYARWAGAWPFPHHPSRRNKLICGDMAIYEIPITRGIRILFGNDPNRVLDMRAETPLDIGGPEGETFRKIIEENLDEMEKRDQPVRFLGSASHNTNPYGDRSSYQYRNLKNVCGLARECAEKRGYTFRPAHFLEIRDEANRLGAF